MDGGRAIEVLRRAEPARSEALARQRRAGHRQLQGHAADGRRRALLQHAAVDRRRGRRARPGARRWVYNPRSYEAGTTTMTLRWNQRGVAYWSDGGRRADLLGHRRRLPDCRGRQDRQARSRLRRQRPRRSDGRPAARQARLARLPQRAHLLRAVAADRRPRRRHRAGLDLVADLAEGTDPRLHPRLRRRAPGKVRWTFHTVPQPGEIGHDSWKDNAWEYAGKVTVWTMMSARRGARVRLPADQHDRARLLRRASPRRQPVRREPASASTSTTGQARLALPDRAPRPVGLRQPAPRRTCSTSP